MVLASGTPKCKHSKFYDACGEINDNVQLPCCGTFILITFSYIFTIMTESYLISLISAEVWEADKHFNSLFNICFTLLFVCFKIKPNQRKGVKVIMDGRAAA